MTAAQFIVGNHLRATPDGEVVVRLRGSGLATLTLRSARPITPRWLTSSRPRHVRLGMRRVALQPDVVTTVTFRLSRDDLALLHRMRTMRVTIRLQTDERVRTRRVDLHSPASMRLRSRGRTRSTRGRSVSTRRRRSDLDCAARDDPGAPAGTAVGDNATRALR